LNQNEEGVENLISRAISFEPQPIDSSSVALPTDFEEIIKSFSEHVHDYWCFNKVRILFKNLEKKKPVLFFLVKVVIINNLFFQKENNSFGFFLRNSIYLRKNI
jgi:hypothetical protein